MYLAVPMDTNTSGRHAVSMDGRRVEQRLRQAAALGLAWGLGCGPAVDDTPPDSGSSSSSTTGTTTTATADGSGPVSTSGPMKLDLGPAPTGGDDGPRFDLGVQPDIPAEGTVCVPPPGTPDCDEPLESGKEGDEVFMAICPTVAEGFECDELQPEFFLAAAEDCLGCDRELRRIACEPFAYTDGSRCCSWVVAGPVDCPAPGRPFLVEGQARVPAVVQRADWARRCEPRLEGLDAPTRAALAQAWAHDACYEAASVASFSRFVMQLLSLGAPPQLVERAQAALADEVEHARALFGLASAYADQPLGPGGLPIEHALHEASDPLAAAVALTKEGCIGETISAMQVAVAAQRAEDPAVRSLLAKIAEEELRHAELAWSTLGWLLARSDTAVRSAVAEVFAHASQAVPHAENVADALDPATLRAAGRLTAQERLDVAQRALAGCIASSAATVLRPWTTNAPTHATMA